MEIIEIKTNKKRYIDLLLLADEQESMIDRYIERGTMYALFDGSFVKTVCVVTDEGEGVLEIKNLATDPAFQKSGCGRLMIEFVAEKYSKEYSVLKVGTGDSPLTISFYEKCGFTRSHIVKDFFIKNYDHPIYEGGIQLRDMVYLIRKLHE